MRNKGNRIFFSSSWPSQPSSQENIWRKWGAKVQLPLHTIASWQRKRSINILWVRSEDLSQGWTFPPAPNSQARFWEKWENSFLARVNREPCPEKSFSENVNNVFTYQFFLKKIVHYDVHRGSKTIECWLQDCPVWSRHRASSQVYAKNPHTWYKQRIFQNVAECSSLLRSQTPSGHPHLIGSWWSKEFAEHLYSHYY